MPREDIASLEALARALVADGLDDAAAGIPLSQGGTAVLRRMRDTPEVRGIVLAKPCDPRDVLKLLDDPLFWAKRDFASAQRVDASLEPGPEPLPDRWALRMRRMPDGHGPLVSHGPERSQVAGTPAGGRARAVDESGRARPVRRKDAFRDMPPDRGDPPGWTLALCASCTGAALLFLAAALAHRATAARVPATTLPLLPAPPGTGIGANPPSTKP